MEERQSNIMDSYESTENALMDSFKAAALKVTTLYKDSLVHNRKAYAAGYQQALQDLYGFISAQPENGFVAVQDVLNFAREKNNQLSIEMNGQASSSTKQSKPFSEQQQKNNNIFQIDPQTQFTFTHEAPNSLSFRTMNDIWDQATTLASDSSKRRFIPNDLNFMGRTMNFDSWQEPPIKRGRTRKED